MQPQGARVVTPEAVVLDVQTAGLGSRALARAIDTMIQGTVLVVISPILVAGTVGMVIGLFLLTVDVFVYPIIWESLWRGRTPGKAALGLRVVTRQGAPIRFRHAVVRGVLGLGEVLALPVVAVVAMLASPIDQRLGDMAAGTIVIRERSTAKMSRPVMFFPPVGWEAFVDSLDVGGVTAGEYENIRMFLIRAQEMAPLSRSSLAARLASPLVDRLHQPVPAGAGPELWLACVACGYQRRHGAPAGPWGPGQWGPGQWGPGGPGAPGPWGPAGPGAPGQWGPGGPGQWGPAAAPGQWGPPPGAAVQPADQWGLATPAQPVKASSPPPVRPVTPSALEVPPPHDVPWSPAPWSPASAVPGSAVPGPASPAPLPLRPSAPPPAGPSNGGFAPPD